MLTPFSTSQSRITRNDPVVVLNVRVSACRPRRAPGVRTQTVTDAFPTSRPATRSYNTSIAITPLLEPTPGTVRVGPGTCVDRRILCQDTGPRARSNNPEGSRGPRAIHLYGLSRTSVT